MPLRASTLCLLLALAAPIGARADNPAQPIPADGKCSVQTDPTWTKQEQFVWRNVCLGKEADFNKEPGYGGDLDPKGEAGLPDSRILRSSFLETILLKDKYRSALTRLGVRITGARFTEAIDLENAELRHDLWLDRSLLEKAVDLAGMKTSRRLTFDESKIVGQMDGAEAQIDADLSMHGAEIAGSIDLTRAHVGNTINFEGAKFADLLNMETIDIGHDLLMDGQAEFKEVDLTSAHIGGQLALRTSSVSDKLDMAGIVVDRELLADDAKFNEIDLSGAHVASLELSGAKVDGALNLNTINVRQNLFLSDGAQFKNIDLVAAHIGGQLNLHAATVADKLDMAGIVVDRELLADDAKFNEIDLSNAHVASLELSGARVDGALNLNTINVRQNLFLGDGAQFKNVDLVAAHIGGQLNLHAATVADKLGMNEIVVDRDLFADDAKFNEIDLGGAHVASLVLTGTKVDGALSLNGINVRQNLSLGVGAQFKSVDLVGAHIGEQLDLRTATVADKLGMNGIVVDQGLFASDARFNEVDLGGAHVASVVLSDTKVDGVLNLNAINVRQDLSLDVGAQFKSVDLVAAHIGGQLNLRTATVADTLDMNGIVVDQDLFADDAKFNDVDLGGGHVASLSLNETQVTGTLTMGGLHVDQDLMMSGKARFNDISLVGAHIGRAVSLGGSTVTGKLNMDGARIEQNLIMNGEARFNEISLIAAHVAGQFNLDSATVEGKFVGDYLAVDHTVFSGNGAEFKDEIALASAKLGHDLYLSKGRFHKSFSLADTQIVGALGLNDTKWLSDATLDLTGASAGGIDLSDNWPDKMLLNGFAYRNLFNIPENISKQAEDWFKKQAYAPQPYEQLASVLQANGMVDDAIDVRYAGKDAELRAASGWRRIWLFLLKWSIGFGYRLQDAFAWAAAFVLLGWAVLYATGQRTKHGMTLGLVYSFDMLLPLVQLSKKHDDVDLDPWPRRYFYVHKMIGVILASFIVAGISGLTK